MLSANWTLGVFLFFWLFFFAPYGAESRSKVFPYFFPLQKFFPLTLFFACFKKPLKTLHFLSAIYADFSISDNSNPSPAAMKPSVKAGGFLFF